MLYFTTETLIRMLLMAAVLDLAFLSLVLFVLSMALWSARDVLSNLNIEYRVERDMRKWRVQQYEKEQQEEASQAK
jgi:hypothetical protein